MPSLPRRDRSVRLTEMALATPAERERYVDLLRVLAVAVVVLGHWLAAVVTYREGRLGGAHALAVLPWTQHLTWLAQVMPLVFVVGGYANAASWLSPRRRGGWAGWALLRSRRLLRPTTAFVVPLVGAAGIARAAGVPAEMVDRAAWLAGIALWFLVVYLVVVALAPLLVVAQQRWGLVVVAALAGAVVAGDVLRLAGGLPGIGQANYLSGWLFAHQLGIAWRCGGLRGRRTPLLLAGLGALALLALTTLGPYPTSMVAVPGEPASNTAPPSVALLALTVTHTGLVLLLHRPVTRWLARPRVWRAVVAGNAVVLTLYLWHMVPVVVAAVTLYPAGIAPQPPVGSPAWYALRVPWVALLAVLLAVAVRLAGPVELRPLARPQRARPILVLPGVAAAVCGLLLLVLDGLHGAGPLGIPLGPLFLYGAGVGLLAVADRGGPVRPRA